MVDGEKAITGGNDGYEGRSNPLRRHPRYLRYLLFDASEVLSQVPAGLDYHGPVRQTGESRNHPFRFLLDELDYPPIDKRGADLLFQVVAARYEVGSIVISTNRPFREWGTILDVDNTLATALIDRLMHHGEGIVIQGDSYRMKDKDPNSTDE